MGTITFDPAQIASNVTDIGSNSGLIVDNDTDISSNYAIASDASDDIVSNDTDIASNYVVGSDASAGVAGAVSDASEASVAASSAVSDVDIIEADDRYAKSIYSDPATASFAITQIDVAADSKIYLSHTDSAIE